ncbi:unnamed protein product [Leptosia nina]|uniref:Uncharacterized protein n=1 Tax=Leptosia nina TaxID=320188 RepID=A0AAV1IYP5_9NEOP
MLSGHTASSFGKPLSPATSRETYRQNTIILKMQLSLTTEPLSEVQQFEECSLQRRSTSVIRNIHRFGEAKAEIAGARSPSPARHLHPRAEAIQKECPSMHHYPRKSGAYVARFIAH